MTGTRPSPTSSLLSPSSLALIAALFVVSFLTDVLSKEILRTHALPLTLTMTQFAMSTLTALALLLTLHSGVHRLSLETLPALAPIVVVHTVGFLTTNVSLATLPVSFTHTIKASEALFTAGVSRLVLRTPMSAGLYASLLPIVAGVALSSATELSFDWMGFIAALTSNLCFAFRTVLSGSLMNHSQSKINGAKHSQSQVPLDDVNLYFYISLFATLLLLPVWYHCEYQLMPPLVTPFLASLSSLSLSSLTSSHALWIFVASSLLLSLALNGVGHYTYNQCSMALLSRVAPITHVVIGALRRLTVIYLSVVWFGQKLTVSSMAGTVLVVSGVIAFAREKSKLNNHTSKKAQ